MKLIFNQAMHLNLPRSQAQVGQTQKPVEGQQKAAPIAKPADQSKPVKSSE